jgi:3-oxoacyl-[acyl-carrier protein] reductase
MDLGLKDKVALVAAAGQGLGYGTARALAREGAKVSICSHLPDEIEAAAKRLADETGAEVLASVCDVRDPAAIQAWVDRTVQTWGRVDALFINAGGPPAGSFDEVIDAQWQAAFELTLMSAVRLIRAALPHMGTGAAIVASTSSSVIEPIERLILSNVMRAGVAALIKSLADELAPKGIRANTLIPGRIDTERVAQLDRIKAEKLGVSFEEVRAQSVATIPLGRLGTIDEYGAAAAFLLSPVASYITGATLRVDGGKIRAIT